MHYVFFKQKWSSELKNKVNEYYHKILETEPDKPLPAEDLTELINFILYEDKNEIDKWRQQQKDDYNTFLEKTKKLEAELQQSICLLEKSTYTSDVRGEAISKAIEILNEYSNCNNNYNESTSIKKRNERLHKRLQEVLK